MRSAATASARRFIPTTRSASGPRARAATNWCRSARPISASPTPSLLEIDRFVRRNTIERFGPVREVVHERRQRSGVRSRVRGPAALDPPQVRPRDAVSAHQPAALGQAAARRRPAGNAGGDFAQDRKPADAALMRKHRGRAARESAMIASCYGTDGLNRSRRMSNGTARPLSRRIAAVGCGAAGTAVHPGRRHPVGARLRPVEHLAQPAKSRPRASGTWASTRSGGCGAISCSAP